LITLSAFICAIREIFGPSSLSRKPPSAFMRVPSWSAANGRGYTGWLSSGDTGPTFVTKRVRC